MAKIESIKVSLFEPWMHHEVVEMICRQYGRMKKKQSILMKTFYDHPYQKEKAIRLVALFNGRVVGFQSLFYWPYLLNGETKCSFQSGNSIVDIKCRKQGIFSLLLSRLNDICKEKNIDFLVGFPVQDSLNCFIRDGWHNVLDLEWLIKPITPLSIFKKLDFNKLSIDKKPQSVFSIPYRKGLTMNNDHDFEVWRSNLTADNQHLFFYFFKNTNQLRFDLKVKMRGILKELVIGRIIVNTDDPHFLRKALKVFIKEVRHYGAITFISVALNEVFYKSYLFHALREAGFLRTKKKIHFIVKNFMLDNHVLKPSLWEIYAADIDSW